ncbi:MAG TPA: phosphatidylserine decarboxylase [Thermoplasmata archaeon]|nr:phosphatidylserine decarboxylase [Thermoplasmata archaeon]
MIAKGGRGFVLAGTAATLVAVLFNTYAAITLAGLTLFLVVVFRDPRRTIGDGIVAPADGTVREIDQEKGLVSTYLALRNVHVTRAPIDGVVQKKSRWHGKHAPAFSKKTVHNERLEIRLGTRLGEVSIVQMTGAIARRIVPYVSEGESLGKGQKLGLIRFGSRVDVFMPPSTVKILVKKGDKLRAGVTRIAEVCDGRVE